MIRMCLPMVFHHAGEGVSLDNPNNASLIYQLWLKMVTLTILVIRHDDNARAIPNQRPRDSCLSLYLFGGDRHCMIVGQRATSS